MTPSERSPRARPPGLLRLHAACGLADLVRVRGRLGDEYVATMARVLGYEVPAVADTAANSGEGGSRLRQEIPRLGRRFQWIDLPFLRAVSFDPKEDPLADEPAQEENQGRLELTAGLPPEAPPIVDWARLRAHLRPFLARDAGRRAIDLDAAVERVARGERLSVLPSSTRGRMATRMVVINDTESTRMFGRDVGWVRNKLERVLGDHRVLRWGYAHGPESALNTGDRGPDGTPHVLGPDDPVLLLGDLGATSVRRQQEWLRYGRELRARGHRVHALTTRSPAPLPDPLREVWRPTRWDLRAPAADRPQERARQLLGFLAPAVRIEPGLLREVRQQVFPRFGIDVEIEVPGLTEVEGSWATLLSIEEEASKGMRARWRESFSKDQRRKLVGLLRRWHAGVAPLAWAEEAYCLHQLDPDPSMVSWPEVERARDTLERVVLQMVEDESAGRPRRYRGDWVVGLPERSAEVLTDDRIAAALDRAREFMPAIRLPDSVRDRISQRSSDHDRGWWWARCDTSLALVPFDSLGPSSVPPGAGLLAPIVARERKLRIRGGEDVPLESTTTYDRHPGRRFSMETDLGTWHVDSITKPAWATHLGRDEYGLFAEIQVGEARHRLRWIPPGRFWMGSPATEAGRWDDETLHEVVLTRGYWLGETPVTQDLYESVMGENPSRFQSADRPVEQVSFEDVSRFLGRLPNCLVGGEGESDGLTWRLPTEAEWEHACRAGTRSSTYVGELRIEGERNAPLLDEIAWYGGNCGVGYELSEGHDMSGWPERHHEDSPGGTHPVGKKSANGFGLYDMLGNVLEWCLDRTTGSTTASSAALAVDPLHVDAAGTGRVIRGGSWFSFARFCRSAYRRADGPSYRDVNLGFRLSRGLELEVGGADSSSGRRPASSAGGAGPVGVEPDAGGVRDTPRRASPGREGG